MEGNIHIIFTKDFTYINFSIFPEIATYFQHKYAPPETTITISGKNCIRLLPFAVLTLLVTGSFILLFNRRSLLCSHFNNTLIENLHEGRLIPIKRKLLFKFIPGMLSRFQENEWREIILIVSWTSDKRRNQCVIAVHKLNELEYRRPSAWLGLWSGRCDLTSVNASPASGFRSTGRSRPVSWHDSTR